MTRLRRALLSAAVALLAGAAVAAAEEPRVTVRLAPDPVGLDEIATLEIHVDSSGFDSPEIDPAFELENLEIVGGPVRAQSHSWVNGRTSSSFQLLWRLRPRGLGPARVTGVRVAVDEVTLEVADQEIEVVEAAAPGRSGAAGGPSPGSPADPFDQLFQATPGRRPRSATDPQVRVRAEVEPSNPYVGQQTSYRLVLYTQTDISAFSPQGLPDFRGLWTREVDLPDRARPEWVELEGERYGRVVMLQRSLYPLSPGRFELEPIDVDVVLRVARAGFFGPFGRNEPRRLRTNSVAIGVRPLPPPPPAFSGVVGDLRVKARLDRPETQVGQAATLAVEIESRGNLQGLAAPELALPPGLTSYAPRPESGDRVAGGSLSSRQTWSYVLIPDRPGEYTLPSIPVVYFDPGAAVYRTAASSPLALAVRGAPAAPAPEPSATSPRATASPAPPRVGAAPPLFVWVGGAAGVALLLAFGYLLGRRGARPGGEARGRLLQRLTLAEREAPRPAAEAFEAAWRAFLGERFGLPPETAAAEIPARLRERGVADAGATGVAALLEEIDYLRHAPELSDVSHLGREIVERSKRLARMLR